MIPQNKDFRDRLLAAQAQDEQLKARYEKEIRGMMEPKLTRAVKGFLVVLIGLCLFAAFVTVANLKRLNPELLIPGVAFELTMAGCLSWIVWRGSLNRAAHGFVLAGAAGVFSLCAACFFVDALRGMPEHQRPPQVTAAVIVTLILGWLPMLLVTLSHYHNRTRERLLEIQYQIAELAEEIRSRR